VLILLSRDRNQPLRQVAQTIGLTERAVQRMVADLESAGYLTRERKGRQNVYKLHRDAPFKHPIIQSATLGEFLEFCNPALDLDEIEAERLLGNWIVGEHGSEVK